MEQATAPERLWELDALRTMAIAMMVVYHVAYDIEFLAPQSAVDPFNGLWRALQVTCGSTFLGVVGLTFWVRHAQLAAQGRRRMEAWRHHARRAVEVLAAAALVTAVTLLVLGPEDAVRFGILHLIGVLMLVVLPLVVRRGRWNLLLGTIVAAVGVSGEVRSDVPGLLIFGFVPSDKGVDWYPLVPWAGPALIGAGLGSLLYPDGRRGALPRRLPPASAPQVRLGAPGRHSLPIYLIHQPVLIALTAGVLAITGTRIDPG